MTTPSEWLSEVEHRQRLEQTRLVASLAVLGSFDPSQLDRERMSNVLRLCALRTPSSDAPTRWMLTENVRIAALAHQLRQGGLSALRDLRAQAHVHFEDTLQRTLDAWLLDRGWPKLLDATEDELVACTHVNRWARSAILDAGTAIGDYAGPGLDELEGRLAVLEVTRPVRWLIRKPVLGRDRELGALLVYLQEPSMGGLYDDPAFCIHGIGGVGKSTLVAAFVMKLIDHEAGRRPWAYLDFDRRTLKPHDPFTIIADIYRQVGAQYPAIRRVAERERTSLLEGRRSSGLESADTRGSYREAARALAATLREVGPTCVIVLDTCEEVQRTPWIADVFGLFDALAVAHGQLKLVVAGRSEVPEFTVPQRPDRVMTVRWLEHPVAIEILRSQVEAPLDPELAREVVDLVGGNPLSLALAARVLVHDKLTVLADAVQRARALGRVRDEFVRGFLYRRVLDHLQGRDPERRQALRAIARASLALHQVTRDLIEQVLAPAAGVSGVDADKLYDDLSIEVGFVQSAGGALRLREDVRVPALGALRLEDAAFVQRIHAAAREYYARERSSPEARIELLYHALALDDATVLRGVAQADLAELHRYVAGLPPSSVAAIELARADSGTADLLLGRNEELLQWERRVLERVDSALRIGDTKVARELLFERPSRSAASELYRLESRLHEAEGRMDGAIASAHMDLAAAHQAAHDERIGAAAIRLAGLLERHGAGRKALEVLDETDRARLLARNTQLRLELLLHRLNTAERTVAWTDEERWLPGLEVLRRMKQLGPGVDGREALIRLIAAALGREEPSYLRRAIQRVGLGAEAAPERIDALTDAIVEWERSSTKDLASVAGVTRQDREHRAHWRERVSALGSDVGALVDKLWSVEEPPQAVTEALRAFYLWWAIPFKAAAKSAPSKSFLDDVPLDFSKQETQELENLLLAACPEAHDLEYMLTILGMDSTGFDLGQSPRFIIRDLLQRAASASMTGNVVSFAMQTGEAIESRIRILIGNEWLVAHARPLPSMLTKHTILVLAADPTRTDRLALDREARAIKAALERGRFRGQLEIEIRWAAEPLDLLRELRKLKPTVVHFSGHGDPGGLFFQGSDGRARSASTAALAEMFGAAARPIQLVVLDACYTDAQAEALLPHVDCIVGLSPSSREDDARDFATGFYGALADHQSVAKAYERACAAIDMKDRPRLKVRPGIDSNRLILAGLSAGTAPVDAPALSPMLAGHDDAPRVASTPIELGQPTLVPFSGLEARAPAQAQVSTDRWPLNAMERQRHLRCLGRETVLALLDEWLLGPDEGGWVVVTGSAGIGKSTILSAWLTRHETDGGIIPQHFIRRQLADWNQPEVIAVSLATQIEAVFPELHDCDAKPERRLLELLGRVSTQLGSSGRMVLVIDGLDETRAEPGDNPLPRFLPAVLPPGIKVLCATRPAYPYLSWIEASSSIRRLDLDESRWAPSNEGVVRGVWEAVAPEYQPPLSAETIATAIASADGNVTHAEMLHRSWRDLPPWERRADLIPNRLERLFSSIWERIASDESIRVGFGLLCAARDALSLDILADLAEWTSEERGRFARDARQLLFEEPASWAGVTAYRLSHNRVRDLIAESLGARALRAHHGVLAHRLASWPPPAEPTWRPYAVGHALTHRIAIDDWTGVRAVASDLSYLEARTRAADVHRIVQELSEARAQCPIPAVARNLADLARALARDSQWVRSDPGATAGLIWNRLRRSGWTVADLDARLKVPAEASFWRVRHAWSRESASLERTLDGHTDVVTDCVVTPDGRRAVSASVDRTLRIWDLNTGLCLATLDGHTDAVTACAITPDGRLVISASADGTLKVWEVDAGRILSTLAVHDVGVNACAVTPDGRHVIAAAADGRLQIWDLDSGRIVVTLHGHARGVTGCAVTPDGRRVVSASADLTLKVWDLHTHRAVLTLEGHTGWVEACAVTPDDRYAVSASSDRTLKVWDLDTGRLLNTLEGHTDVVSACAVTPDGRHVISASHDRTLKVWNLDTAQVLTTLEGHAREVYACAVTPEGRRVVSASLDHTLKIWDLDIARTGAVPAGHADTVSSCAVVPDGRRAVSASRDGTLKIWDLHDGRILSTLDAHDNWINACAVTPDGRRAITASEDGTLKVWDLDSGTLLTTLENDAGAVRACAMTPDGCHLVSAFQDGRLKICYLDTGLVVTTLEGHADVVTACAVTPDGERVLSASDDRTLRIWELGTGRTLVTLRGHTDRVTACAVTPDGKRVLSASDDRTLKVWDLAGRVLATLDGHTGAVRACAVTPDGQYAISASDDRTLKVWDLPSARCVLAHHGDTGFHCVAATTEGVIAGDRSGTVWFLERPRESSLLLESRTETSAILPAGSKMPELLIKKHTILFLAANPRGMDRLAIDEEARAIQQELENSGYRDRFEFATRWAVQPLDLVRELRRLKPTVVHFSGHGMASKRRLGGESRRDIVGPDEDEREEHGLFFHSPDGRPILVSTQALAQVFGMAGGSVKLVLLSACYSEAQADALLEHVDCVIGTRGLIADDAARFFSIGFYSALGEYESIATAFRQGQAAVRLEALPDADLLHLKVRSGVDPARLGLAADTR